MEFLSIKTFLKHSGRVQPEDYLHVIELLLNGIALHAVQGDTEDLFRFQDDVRTIARTIGTDSSREDLLVSTNRALRALEEYSRHTQKFMRAQSIELQGMLSMLTQTVSSLSASGRENIEQLQSIEKKIEKASVIEDIRSLRIQLAECLGTLRTETLRQREEASRTIFDLDAGVSNVKARLGGAQIVVPDPDTGLSTRSEAEKAIAFSSQADGTYYAAFFVLENLHSVHSRFGNKIQIEVLRIFAEHLSNAFGGTEHLYRWSAASLVAVLERNVPFVKFQAEVRHVASVKLQKTLKINSREVLLPVGCRWFALPVTKNDDSDVLFSKMDAFLAAQVGTLES